MPETCQFGGISIEGGKLRGSIHSCVWDTEIMYLFLLFLCGWGAEVSNCSALGVLVAVILHASFSILILLSP